MCGSYCWKPFTLLNLVCLLPLREDSLHVKLFRLHNRQVSNADSRHIYKNFSEREWFDLSPTTTLLSVSGTRTSTSTNLATLQDEKRSQAARTAEKPNVWIAMMALILIGLIAVAAASQISLPSTHQEAKENPTPLLSGVIVQMFEWSWDSIAAECGGFLGPAGYGFVQASPAQEHIKGDQWWTDYQPVSYTLNSKRGSREQYQNMINACHAAGVKVIADTIFNHMSAGDAGGTGVAGTSYTHYDYSNTYSSQNFHYCGLEPDNDIKDYTNRKEVQTCELVNLADLATETEYVRAKLANYANDLMSLGVDGLRLDAAKHIAASDIINITSRFQNKPYITQEVIYGQGEAVQPSEYVGIGDVQEFRYTSTLKDAFSTSGISGLQDLDSKGWIDGSHANVFVANHDTERNGAGLNYKAPSNTYILATVFSLAHPYGTPTVLSSYDMSDNDQGGPNGGAGTCSTSGGANGWLCQHRWTAFTGMIGFRNTVGDESLGDWVASTSQQIAFGRGRKGFVAINNADSEWTMKFVTSLPAGTYCDVIHGTEAPGKCHSPVYTVAKDGTFSATIPARDALALHVGALSSNLPVLVKDAYERTIDAAGSPNKNSGRRRWVRGGHWTEVARH